PPEVATGAGEEDVVPAAIVNVCTDPRLDHASIRRQVGARLQREGLSADRIFITNEAGANPGSAVTSTLATLRAQGDDVVLAAVLHHDDCLAAASGLRRPLAESDAELRTLVATSNPRVRMLTGEIRTGGGYISWSDERARRYEVVG